MFDFGDSEIITGSDIGANYMSRIGHPIAFKRAMMEAKQHYHRGFGYLDPQSVAAYVQTQEQEHSAIPASVEATLQKLAELRDQGVLSQDEFENKRRELLSRI
jgi:hypothetical protein